MKRAATWLTCLPLLLALLLAGCSTSKVTSTERSAVEMALLSESATRTLNQLEGPMLYYNRFYIDDTALTVPDSEFILSAMRYRLLDMGMHAVEKKEDADVIVYPRVHAAAIDESSSLIGIPEFPVAIPGAGTVTTPELALYKKLSQYGVNKMGLYAVDAKDHSLAFDLGTASSRTKYTRWTVLLFISFATTDLPKPYHGKPKKEDQPKEPEY